MSNFDIIRAWKDEDYRNSLTEEQKSQLPENPAGVVDLNDEITEKVSGGYIRAKLPREFFVAASSQYLLGCPVSSLESHGC